MHNCSFICIPCKCDTKWHDADWSNNGKKCDSFNYNFNGYNQREYSNYSQPNYQSFSQQGYQKNNYGCQCNKREEKKENCCHPKSCCFCDFFKSWNDF